MATNAELIERFGYPEPTIKFEGANLTLWDVPDDINRELPAIPNKIYCHNLMVTPLEKTFRDLITAYKTGKLKPKDSLLTWDGCFNIRKSRGLKSLSMHSWGLAVDINAFRNQLGQEPTFSEAFVKIWECNGFEWGGRWKRKDGMHFQLDMTKF